jgi:hypothetical protein
MPRLIVRDGALPAATFDMQLADVHLVVRLDATHYNDPAPNAPPGRTERLWETEVAELFIAGCNGHYVEIEVGPHGHFLAYEFSDIRVLADPELPIEIHWPTAEGASWTAEFRIQRDRLPPQPWRVNAFLINGLSDKRQWLSAFEMPAPRGPDFHQPAHFRSFDELA